MNHYSGNLIGTPAVPRPGAVLLALYEAQGEWPGACSLARLRKKCGLRMSELLRDLTTLSGGGWLILETDPQGRTTVQVSATGNIVCKALLGAG